MTKLSLPPARELNKVRDYWRELSILALAAVSCVLFKLLIESHGETAAEKDRFKDYLMNETKQTNEDNKKLNEILYLTNRNNEVLYIDSSAHAAFHAK